MDLDEWELVPDEGFLEVNDDGGKKIFSRKYDTDPKDVLDMYFRCPSPKAQISRVPSQLVPLPIQLEPYPPIDKAMDHELVKGKLPIEIRVVPSDISEKIKAPTLVGGAQEADQDTIAQVFFKKMKETEFVDMKMDSPRSSSKGIMPQIDMGTFQFEDKGEAFQKDAPESKNCSSKMNAQKSSDVKRDDNWEQSNDGLNILKWSFTGIGAICSLGVAAATICFFIFGSRQKNRQPHQNQKLRFQIYTDDKRIKQMVHHATKLNEAISAVRGVPIATAHITVGGYYESL